MARVLTIAAAWVASIVLYFTILGLFDIGIATLALLAFIGLGVAAWVKDERRKQS